MVLIKDPGLDNYSIKINEFNTQIMLNDLLDLDMKSINIEGVWGDYFDGDEKIVLEVHNLIEIYSKAESVDVIKPHRN